MGHEECAKALHAATRTQHKSAPSSRRVEAEPGLTTPLISSEMPSAAEEALETIHDAVSEDGTWDGSSTAGTSTGQSFSQCVELSAGTRLLIESASLGDVSSVANSLAKGVDPNQGDYDGRTALHLAANLGKFDVVRCLLKHPSIVVDVFDRWGKTPLQDAVENRHEEIGAYLRRHGATVKNAKTGMC